MSGKEDKPKTPLRRMGPVTQSRFTPLSERLPWPSAKVDEVAIAIAKRDAQINQLLQHEFGSLAPPPPPSLRSGPSARDAEARIRHDNIERRRKEYEALDAADLQSRIDLLHAEWSAQAKKRLVEVTAARELRWPHWAKKDLWNEAEFAALCCGLVPDERGMPGDPGKVAGDDSQAIAILRAGDDIKRGRQSGALSYIDRADASLGDRMYHCERDYRPAIAAEWAAERFSTFPPSLLAAVRKRAQVAPTSPASGWPWGSYETELLRKLAAAANRFWKLYDPRDTSTAPTNDAVVAWLKQQGVAERNAQVMATILRADRLPTGPRK